MTHRARIGLGANLGNAEATLEAAFEALSALGRLLARSALYRSRAWGIRDQPDFVNAAALLETRLPPLELLAGLKSLETQLGRMQTYRWGPRVIDFDILTYDDLRFDDPALTLPHPGLFERAFVLAPLAEIDPGYLPAYQSLTPQARSEVERLIRPKQ